MINFSHFPVQASIPQSVKFKASVCVRVCGRAGGWLLGMPEADTCWLAETQEKFIPYYSQSTGT